MDSKIKNKIRISDLLNFAGKQKPLIYLSCVLSALSAVFMLMPFMSIYFAIKEVITLMPNLDELDLDKLKLYGVSAVIVAVIGFILYYFSLVCSHLTAFKIAQNMKSKVIHHLTTLPLGYFKKHSSGKIRKIIEENTSQTEMFIAHQLPDVVGSMVTPVIIIIMLLYFDIRLGLVSLCVIVLGFLCQMSMMGGKKNQMSLTKYQNALENMNTEAVEYVRGIAVVKTFGQTMFTFKNFTKAIIEYKDFVLSYTLYCKRPMVMFVTIINSSFFLLIPVGILLSKSTTNYKEFLLSLIFYLIFTPACSVMLTKMMYAASYQMVALEAVKRINSILEVKPLKTTTKAKMPKNNTIKFENVTFRYEGLNHDVLKNVSFVVEEGGITALVGESGGGKSTIASLIPRFWDIENGSIKIGDTDVRDIASDVLANIISYSFQDSKVFKDSIYNNVLMSKPNAREEEVMKALRLAQCSDIIEKLEKGVHTVIGEKGIYLSGGETQRIALARAILKDSPIIILDEATAFADPENEYKIHLAFKELAKNKTVIIIAHRLTSIIHVDNILLVDDGTIKEQGSHKELLGMNGIYASMWNDYQLSVDWNIGK